MRCQTPQPSNSSSNGFAPSPQSDPRQRRLPDRARLGHRRRRPRRQHGPWHEGGRGGDRRRRVRGARRAVQEGRHDPGQHRRWSERARCTARSSCGWALPSPAPRVDAAAVGKGLRAGVEGIVARGKAELGDKTMYDAWAPAVDAFDAAAAEGVAAAFAAAAAGGGRRSGLCHRRRWLARAAPATSVNAAPDIRTLERRVRRSCSRLPSPRSRDRHRRRLAQPCAGRGGGRARRRDGRGVRAAADRDRGRARCDDVRH